jgi:hypothetical protein
LIFRHFRCAFREEISTPLRAYVGVESLSDKFGHGNCVILRDSAIQKILGVAVNALIAADFGKIRAKSRSV